MKGSFILRSCPQILSRMFFNMMYHMSRSIECRGPVLYLQGNESDSNLLIQDSIRILEEGGMGESEICIRRLRFLVQMVKDIMKTL
ncbi:hypothetical protein QJS04_geneDACA012009 [Acorus gramineus]|uniref:Uncharacterized protein n=1 Tax=Acorus gramineus TaxID=55184 RepID=A0AAV9AHW9_ACOGR|nr:hypothetical protein QJS04_geneDACA012009 [Acorus gramineus]